MTKKLSPPKASPWQLYHAHTSSGITADDSRMQAYRSKAKPTIAQPRRLPDTRTQQPATTREPTAQNMQW